MDKFNEDVLKSIDLIFDAIRALQYLQKIEAKRDNAKAISKLAEAIMILETDYEDVLQP